LVWLKVKPFKYRINTGFGVKFNFQMPDTGYQIPDSLSLGLSCSSSLMQQNPHTRDPVSGIRYPASGISPKKGILLPLLDNPVDYLKLYDVNA